MPSSDAALPCALERHAHGWRESFDPEIRGDPCDLTGDLAFVSGVEREGHEAETREADPDVVDVEVERRRQLSRFGGRND